MQHGRVPGGHAYSRTLHADARGQTILEQWVIHGAGHAWSGGSPAGSYTDPPGLTALSQNHPSPGPRGAPLAKRNRPRILLPPHAGMAKAWNVAIAGS